ncbi:MAG: DUF4097 family beta strand repeat protein [Planctomycetes bacterium]|nr:DUF4097 family beta strand repeat protein [Planctomycetota bacterium]
MPFSSHKFAHRSVSLSLAALVVLAGATGGCMRPNKSRLHIDVPADVAWDVKAPVDLDISNASGTVDIRHKTDIKEPWIDVKRSRPRPTGEMGGPGRNPAQYSEARLVPGTNGGNNTIVIKSTAGDLASPNEWVRITVWVPSLGSVKITNSGGPITLNNPTGTVDIRNQTTKAGHGNITVRTGTISHDVTLISDGGTVDFSTHSDSSLRLDCNTGTGQVRLTSQGAFTGLVSKPGAWSGVLNSGTGRCTINTTDGDVTIRAVK